MDMKNAYGTVERESIMKVLREEKSVALPFVAAEFRSPGYSAIVGSDGEVDILKNRQGVVQGSPMSPPLFCLGFDRALKATRAAHPDVLILAIADDAFLLGTREKVAPCMATLRAEVEKDNLTLQPTKTEFYSPSEPTRVAIREDIDAGRLQGTLNEAGIVVAGIPVSRTREFVEKHLGERLADVANGVVLCGLLKPSLAVYVFRTCIQPKWQHFCRSGILIGLEKGGTLQRVERLEEAFADLIACFDTGLYRANDQLLRAECVRHQRKAPLAQGGVGLALIPERLALVARFAGMVLDVVPGLTGLAMKYNLDFMSGLSQLEEATAGPVNNQHDTYGLHSAPVL